MENVKLDETEDIDVYYPYSTEYQTHRFSYKVPGWLKPTYRKYIGQFAGNAGSTTRFLKNFNNKS